jgi:hypothetical protein
MKLIKSIIGFAALGALFLTACKKEGENIFNMFNDVEVTFHDTHPFSITGYKQVNDGDSVYIDYTITSKDKDMYAACLLEVGTSSPIKTVLNDSQRKSYSGVIKMKATKAGKTSYRIYPLDKVGVYMGDGGKTITIDVLPNISYFNQRIVRVPDSLSKEGECYVSLSTGELFTYNQVMANPELSAKIDFGVYRKFFPEVRNAQNSITQNAHLKYYLYSLSASPLPFSHFDISTWTKRGTLFSTRFTTGSTDFPKFTSGSTIQTSASTKTINQLGPVEIALLSSGTVTASFTNSLLYFKTPEGKYGALYLSSVGANYKTGTYLVFQIKTQK